MDEGPIVVGTDVQAQLDAMRAEIEALSDLFRRRLLDDRTHRHALDLLHARAQTAEAGLGAEFLVPVVSQLIRLADRAEMHAPHDQCAVGSVVDELRDILRDCGVAEIAAAGVPVDGRIHEVRAVTGARPGALYVERIVHRGYSYSGRTLRPATVDAAYRSEPADATTPPAGTGSPDSAQGNHDWSEE